MASRRVDEYAPFWNSGSSNHVVQGANDEQRLETMLNGLLRCPTC